MIMWARIERGAVAEITDINPAGRFHPSMQWVECPDAVGVGWAYDGKTFAEPLVPVEPAPTREQIEVARLRAYADPITGSDRYFAEAQRESLLGNAVCAEAAKALGMARFAEIQAENPWPSE